MQGKTKTNIIESRIGLEQRRLYAVSKLERKWLVLALQLNHRKLGFSQRKLDAAVDMKHTRANNAEDAAMLYLEHVREFFTFMKILLGVWFVKMLGDKVMAAVGRKLNPCQDGHLWGGVRN